MENLVIFIFCIGYLAIILEHPLKVNKTASALVIGVLCWTVYILSEEDHNLVNFHLQEHMGSITGILFFLMGAMTIVELVDSHHGFDVITNRVTTRSKVKLLWTVAFLTFFLSAVLDNLTTSIVMVSLIKKMLRSSDDRKFFSGMVIIAANSGGAWTPIGDVTTTMLWIGGQITTGNIVKTLFLPSLVSMILPLSMVSFNLKGNFEQPAIKESGSIPRTTPFEQKLVFLLGVLALVSVPVFKILTGLPPHMGILLSLGILWVITELMHKDKDLEHKHAFSVMKALQKIDVASVLFFLGILIAIGSLEAMGLLHTASEFLAKKIGNMDIIVMTIGVLSAIVDNVPLVAAAQGMYSLPPVNPSDIIPGVTYLPTDHKFWEFLAYCAGTGGSILVIGSAAGVAVMGMTKIDFIWYAKKISIWAFIGYFAGAMTYLGVYYLLHH